MQSASLAVARGDDDADDYMPESGAPRETTRTLRPMKTISVKTVAKPFTAVWNALRPKRVPSRQPEPDARTPLVAQERGAAERATGEPR